MATISSSVEGIHVSAVKTTTENAILYINIIYYIEIKFKIYFLVLSFHISLGFQFALTAHKVRLGNYKWTCLFI